MLKEVEIYTDGACSGNPGKGGYGAILIYKNTKKEISGFEEHTTNNRMELSAIISALKLLKESCKIKLYSDSAYCINALNNGWLEKWKKNGWKLDKDKEVKNVDLWKELSELSKIHEITWIKVKGHADNLLNNRCDFLATNEIKKKS